MGSASRRRIEQPTLAEPRAGFSVAARLRSSSARFAQVLFLSSLPSVVGCTSNHHVSPWGNQKGPQLGVYVEAPDLDARIAEVDREAASLGLDLEREITANVKGARFVARSYVGQDQVGKVVHACRVATPFGVVLAAGPANDPLRKSANELVLAVGDSNGFRSLTDLTGTGALDVMLRAEDGRLEMWAVQSRGSVELDIDMEVVPTQASDIDGDGHVDFGGAVIVRDGEALKPLLTDVATFDGTRFTDRTPGAKGWHLHERETHVAKEGASAESKATSALEVAWHSILGGNDRKKTLAELDRTKVPVELKGAFATYELRISRIDPDR